MPRASDDAIRTNNVARWRLWWKVTPQIRAISETGKKCSDWLDADYVVWDKKPPEGLEYQRRIYYEPRLIPRLFGKLPWWVMVRG